MQEDEECCDDADDGVRREVEMRGGPLDGARVRLSKNAQMLTKADSEKIQIYHQDFGHADTFVYLGAYSKDEIVEIIAKCKPLLKKLGFVL